MAHNFSKISIMDILRTPLAKKVIFSLPLIWKIFSENIRVILMPECTKLHHLKNNSGVYSKPLAMRKRDVM